MDFLRAIQILALCEVTAKDPTIGYLVRKIQRWYSTHFNTPLHQVQDLPIVDVFQHYFEVRYESMGFEDLGSEIARLQKNPKTERLEKDREEFEDFQFDREVTKEIEEGKKQFKNTAQKALPLRPTIKNEDVPLPDTQITPIDIKYEFIDPEELDRLTGDVIGGLQNIKILDD